MVSGEAVEIKRGVWLLKVEGRIDSNSAPEMETKLGDMVDAEKTQIILNLKDVEYMSSAGLRAMVSTLKKVKRVNGDLRLCEPSARVHEVLRLAGLTSIFSIYNAQAEAVGSF